MRNLVTALAAVALCAGPALAAPSPRAAGPTQSTHDNPSSCLGYARSGDAQYGNSAFGGRPYGQFGEEQAAVVAAVNAGEFADYENYGDLLADYKDSCEDSDD